MGLGAETRGAEIRGAEIRGAEIRGAEIRGAEIRGAEIRDRPPGVSVYREQRIAVVVPAHNEERHIGGTLRTIPDWVDLVVVVDDRSVDGTHEIVRRSGSARVVCVRLERNLGVGGAILRGYEEAWRRDADVIAVMAGDGQMDPADLAGVVAPVADGAADYAKGERLTHPDLLRTMPPVRIVGNFALTAMTRVVTGYRALLDSQCGYTALRATLVPHLLGRGIYPRYGFPNDLLAHLAVLGARVVDRPVRPVYGSERSGIRWPIAAITISVLLARAWARRLWGMYVRPLVRGELGGELRGERARGRAVVEPELTPPSRLPTPFSLSAGSATAEATAAEPMALDPTADDASRRKAG